MMAGVSRFSLPPDPVFRAAERVDRLRLAPRRPTTSSSRAPTRRCWRRSGSSREADRDELLGGLDRVAGRARRRRVRVPGLRRGHPHGRRAAADRDRRPGRRQAAHRALAQRPGRDRHGDVHPRPRAAGDRVAAGPADACVVRRRRGAPGLGDAGLHAPAARAAGLPLAPPAGVLLDVPARRAALRGRARVDHRAAAGRGRAGGRELRRPTGAWWPPSSASRASCRTRSTPSPTATSCSTSWPPRRPARRTCRGWAPRSCCGPRRSSASARSRDAWASGSSIMPQKKNPDAAELLRAKAPRVVAHLAALHGVMHGLPLTYNKDMQEDKEHLFDAVDTLELCLAAARGMLGGITFQRERLAGAADRRDARRGRRRRHARQARRAVPAVARDRRRAGAHGGRVRPHAVRSSRARSSPSTPTCSTTSSTRCYPRGHGWSPRRARAGRRSARVREQLAHARRSSTASRLDVLDARVLRPPGAGGGAATCSAASSRHGAPPA